MKPALNIVLIEPEIPPNTGTIGRLCLCVNATLHLVKPLGFSLDEQQLRRAGLDYWKYLEIVTHESSEAFFNSLPPDANLVLIETCATKSIYEHSFQEGSYLIFGRETTGLADWILKKYSHHLLKIPMWDTRVRSLNLSNCVSIVTYEALRQIKKL